MAFDYEIASKGILKAIKNYGNIQANEAKLKAAVLSNEYEKKQNLFYKMQELKEKNAMTKQMVQEFGGNQPGGQEVQPDEDVFSARPTPELRAGVGGEAQINYPTTKEFIYKRIQAKKAKGMPLSKKEQDFENEFLGTKGGPQDWDIIKQADANINNRLRTDFAYQAKAAKDPQFLQNERIREQQMLKQRMQNPGQGVQLPTQFPSNIRTTTQAVDYLVSTYGLSKEEAIQHIQSLNQ